MTTWSPLNGWGFSFYFTVFTLFYFCLMSFSLNNYISIHIQYIHVSAYRYRCIPCSYWVFPSVFVESSWVPYRVLFLQSRSGRTLCASNSLNVTFQSLSAFCAFQFVRSLFSHFQLANAFIFLILIFFSLKRVLRFSVFSLHPSRSVTVSPSFSRKNNSPFNFNVNLSKGKSRQKAKF